MPFVSTEGFRLRPAGFDVTSPHRARKGTLVRDDGLV
jgi:hypothetical protein